EIAKIDEQDDTERGRDDDEESKSDEESDEEETREEESFDPIPRTLEDSKDDGNATITTISHAPIPPTTIPSEVLQNLPTFDSVCRFNDRLKSLEANFSEYIQINPFAEAVSNIPGIVHQYMNQQINETDRLRDSYQRENDEFLRNIDDNMKRIIKEQALVETYEADKIILDTYGDTVTLKRRRDDESDKDEGPSAGSDRGSKRRRKGKEPESASAPLQTVTRSAVRSTTRSKSRQTSASESAFTEEPVQTTSQIEKPSHPMFETGRKRQQFYGFTVNRESALDVYSKRRIIALTDLKIMEWHSYKHLDWITRRVEDLQLGVESYQKRLNLTKTDTYWSDLKRREAYTAYSNPRGFIYQNKDKKNRLMRIDELHKFSDGTLNDVRNALDDHLKEIRMQYLPQTIWRKGNKDRAAAMIQAIDKMLKTRRIMRSLERFVGGRLYEGDFQMLQRTI
nr:hypothetical protein [Tanacetum cinerariifolium]